MAGSNQKSLEFKVFMDFLPNALGEERNKRTGRLWYVGLDGQTVLGKSLHLSTHNEFKLEPEDTWFSTREDARAAIRKFNETHKMQLVGGLH